MLISRRAIRVLRMTVTRGMLLCLLVACSRQEPQRTSGGSAPAGAVSQPVASPTPVVPPPSENAPPGKAASSDGKAASSDGKAAYSVGDIVDLLGDAVVFITVSDAMGTDISVGTGCIIDRSGLIATNRHVIEAAVSARVQLRNGAKFPVAGVVASDDAHDLAILLVERLPESTRHFELSKPPVLRQGDRLIAIGHPLEFQFSVSDGILSALRRTEQLPMIYQQGLHLNPNTEWIQTTAAISNGSSGGPLLTEKGQLAGINTWIAAGRSLGFAVSVKHLIELKGKAASQATKLPLPDAPVIVSARIAAMSHDCDKELEELITEMQRSEKTESIRELIEARNPVPVYAAKCVAILENKDRESDWVDAFLLAHRILNASGVLLPPGRRSYSRLYDLASQHLAENDDLQRVMPLLGAGPYSPQMDQFLRRVFRSHRLKSVRARAGWALFLAMRKEVHADWYVPEMLEILEKLKRMYSDVLVAGESTGDMAARELMRLRCLGIGTIAQELAGEDQDGKTLRLADHRGQVVVLDFWADYSPQSRNSYSHFRELVKRMSGKPFKLMGVNCDETRERSEALVKSGVVTWPTLYDGADGRMKQQWMLDRLPADFVIDGRGAIRFTNVWGEELDEAVQSLIEEPLLQFPGDVIPRESEWRWYYGDSPPAGDWPSSGFDDGEWKSGRAPLGYGRPGVKTTLDYGDIDNKRLVACFRKKIQAADAAATGRLFLQLEADDGAVVYLNGQEVYRTNLPGAAGWNTRAICPAERPVTIDLNEKLVAGTNTLAVEVHQVSPQSGDLAFDLSLSSRPPDYRAFLGAESPRTRTQFCQLAAGLTTQDSSLDEVLVALSADRNPEVRAWALVARLQRAADPDSVEVPPPDAETKKARGTAAGLLNGQVWDIVERADFAPVIYERTLRAARAMWRILPTGTAEEANTANTYGVALYRAGQWGKAVEYLKKSSELKGENPLDLSFIALSLEKIGRTREARDAYEKAAAFKSRESWAAMDAAAVALEEAKSVLDP